MNIRRMNNGILEIYDESENFIFSISETIKPKEAASFSFKGELRKDVTFEFEDEIMMAMCMCKKIEIDLADVTYISSDAMMSLNKIKSTADSKNISVVLKRVSKAVLDELDETGVSDLFEIIEK